MKRNPFGLDFLTPRRLLLTCVFFVPACQPIDVANVDAAIVDSGSFDAYRADAAEPPEAGADTSVKPPTDGGDAAACASITFPATTAKYPAAGVPGAFLKSADFDGDGYPDLVFGSGATTIGVNLNKKNGAFGPTTSYTTPNGVTAGTVGDFNKDGWQDIAVLTSYIGPTYVNILMNNKDGTFASTVNYQIADNAFFGMEAADFDGDGYLDLLVPNQDANSVSILLNKKDGTFGAQQSYNSVDGPQQLGVGDFNGDGFPDVVSTSGASKNISVLLNKKNGTLGTPSQLNVGVAGSMAKLLTGDFNKDGSIDIAYVLDDAVVRIFLNNKNGTFGAMTSISTGSAYVEGAALGDIDQDGVLDLVVSGGKSPFGVMLGKNDGTFGPITNYGTPTSSVTDGAGPIVTTDLDKDGHLDMAWIDNRQHQIGVLLAVCK
jgi:FG-GAP-like repeat/FG-GAP repeat